MTIDTTKAFEANVKNALGEQLFAVIGLRTELAAALAERDQLRQTVEQLRKMLEAKKEPENDRSDENEARTD
jgi:regulator of replication initiation timing